jgi:hypothetical protein
MEQIGHAGLLIVAIVAHPSGEVSAGASMD